MLVDSHCHLNMEPLTSNLDAILKRAFDSDVKFLQTICTKREDVDRILEIITSHESVFGSFGLHPNEIGAPDDICADEILSYCKLSPKIISIGETGLDYFRSLEMKGAQKLAFLAHIEASQRSSLPLVIHSRHADDDMCEILTAEMENAPFKGILHCFTGGSSLARTALDLGLFISISGIVTFPKAYELCELVSSFIPASSLLLETDSPYLAPLPHRGGTNEPSFVRHVAQKVASLKEMDFDEFCSITSKNFFSLFNLSACL